MSEINIINIMSPSGTMHWINFDYVVEITYGMSRKYDCCVSTITMAETKRFYHTVELPSSILIRVEDGTVLSGELDGYISAELPR